MQYIPPSVPPARNAKRVPSDLEQAMCKAQNINTREQMPDRQLLQPPTRNRSVARCRCVSEGSNRGALARNPKCCRSKQAK
eukprot:scaffold87447_cov20-Tisochrysis_lutea.AAC.3